MGDISLSDCTLLCLNLQFPAQVYLNLVLEYVPETVFRIGKHYSKSGQRMPTLFVKLYVFQMCRALAHIHAMGVCHRDIKPQNLLVNTQTHELKLCDFGSAKVRRARSQWECKGQQTLSRGHFCKAHNPPTTQPAQVVVPSPVRSNDLSAVAGASS